MRLSIILLFGFFISGYSQDQINSKFERKLTPFISIGGTASLGFNEFSGNNEIDNLIGYEKNQLQFSLSGGVFYQHIGIEFLLTRGANASESDLNSFHEDIRSTFNSNYFVPPQSSEDIIQPNATLLAGPIYRFKMNKFLVITKLLIGSTKFNVEEKLIELKERNNNNTLLASYQTKDGSESFFTISPRISFGYPITKKLFINAELNYNVFRSDIIYTKRLENIFLKEIISTERIDQKKLVHALALGLNLTYNFKL